MDDAQAIALCKKRDPQGFDHLVRKYMRDAYVHALGLLGNHHDALELSQECFVRAYKAIDRFDESRSFYPWLHRILRNACLNFIARKRPLTSADSPNPDQPVLDPPDLTFDPAVLCVRSETNRRLWAAIATLPESLRETLVLFHFQDRRYAEIAEILDIPVGTVMSRLYAARKRLKAVLESDRPLPPADAPPDTEV